MSDYISFHDLSWRMKFSQQCTEYNDGILRRSTTRLLSKPIPENVYLRLENKPVKSSRSEDPSTFLCTPFNARTGREKAIESALKKKVAEGVTGSAVSTGDGHVVWMNRKTFQDKLSESGYDTISEEFYFLVIKVGKHYHEASQHSPCTPKNAPVLAGNSKAAAENNQAAGGDEPEAMARIKRGTPFASIWKAVEKQAEAIMGHKNFKITAGENASISSLLEGDVTRNYQFVVQDQE